MRRGTVTPEIKQAARVLWDYHGIYDALGPVDAIVCLGSYDLRVAERGAELFAQGYAPRIVFTGASGNWTKGLFDTSEAATFADHAIAHGVPESAVVLEERATNIGENIRFSAALLEPAARVILVTKPQTQRRCLATVRKQWPEAHALVTAPEHGMDDQPTDAFPLEHLIDEMVGDVFRILTYPDSGFQIPQPVPDDVMAAYEFLKAEGFEGYGMVEFAH